MTQMFNLHPWYVLQFNFSSIEDVRCPLPQMHIEILEIKMSVCRAWRPSEAWRTSCRVCRTTSRSMRSTLTTGPSNSSTRCIRIHSKFEWYNERMTVIKTNKGVLSLLSTEEDGSKLWPKTSWRSKFDWFEDAHSFQIVTKHILP